MSEVRDLVTRYHDWLRDKSVVRQLDDWSEITTPFLDRHNDYVQIYARRENGGFLLTDDGYTLQDLALSGCELGSPHRLAVLQSILNGFGVRKHGQELQLHTNTEEFARRKHNLIQAILAVNDLFVLARPTVKSIFFEDVEQWLDLMEIRYVPRVKITGTTGYDHVFDFVVPKSKTRPERFLRAIAGPNRERAESLAFAWHDTRNARIASAEAYAILNDEERLVPSNVTEALRAYDVTPVPWSVREQFRDRLEA